MLALDDNFAPCEIKKINQKVKVIAQVALPMPEGFANSLKYVNI